MQSLTQIVHKSPQSTSLIPLRALPSLNDDGENNSIEYSALSQIAAARDGPASSRRMFFASTLIGAGTWLGYGSAEEAFAQTNDPSKNNVDFLWEKSPINPKRTKFKVTDAEKRYNVNFVAYLSRFLLSFDPAAQQWWMDRAKEIPKSYSKDEIFDIREEHFARFSASVEVGLQEDDFVGKDGPKRLLESLLNKFGAPSITAGDESDRFSRETKEARRQLALLFGLLEESQPTKEITKLLASIDNGTIENIMLSEDARSAGLLRGFSPGDAPIVGFPQPQAGPDYDQAIGTAAFKPTGKLLRIEVIDGGTGYTKAPDISKLLPDAVVGSEPALAEAKVVNGVLKSIKLTNSGSGYNLDSTEEVKLKPASRDGNSAIIRIIPEMEITSIDMTVAGSGYAVEKPIKVTLVPTAGGEPQQIGIAYPKGKMGSFVAARNPSENKIRNFEKTFTRDEDKIISGASSGGGLPSVPFPEKASCSQQLLALLPQGFGLEFDSKKELYVLSVDKEYQILYPQMILQAPNRPSVPDFGPRGQNPIEKDQKIDLSTFLRFSLSGAICASGVNFALTPLDVVKTKVQIAPERYPKILPSFQSVWKDEGFGTFFTGWLPTLTGHFVGGGVLYGATEAIRRSLIDYAGVNAMTLEVPIILFSASVASAVAGALYCPFDAVRIRSVSQPDYGRNAIETASRMLKEEGIGVLTDAIPVFVAKQVPYAAVKFTIFDLSTEYLYKLYPVAQEDLKLSLGVSLVGGVFAGIAAAAVSNPADAVISEMKVCDAHETTWLLFWCVCPSIRSSLTQRNSLFLFSTLALAKSVTFNITKHYNVFEESKIRPITTRGTTGITGSSWSSGIVQRAFDQNGPLLA